jgi:hypothetical protein
MLSTTIDIQGIITEGQFFQLMNLLQQFEELTDLFRQVTQDIQTIP